MNNVQPANIQERTMDYSLRAIALYQHLQKKKDGAAWVLAKQYLRCATSIGANIAEAQAGESRSDFIHKCAIAQKEARESIYWLRLMTKSCLIPEQRIAPLIQETHEVTAIITKIITNSKKNRPTQD